MMAETVSLQKQAGFRPALWQEYALALLGLLLLTVLCMQIADWIGYWSVALLYLMAVMGFAFALSRGPVLLAAAASAVLWNFFFIPPLYTLHIQTIHDNLMCVVYVLTAFLMAGLTARVRAQEQSGRQREQRLAMLYRLSRQLAVTEGAANLIAATQAAISEVLPAEVRFLPPDAPGQGLSEAEARAAEVASRTGLPAWRFSAAAGELRGHYLPLQTLDGFYGLLAVYAGSLSEGQSQLLETLAQQLALALEREQLQEAQTRHRLSEISENLYNALLNSVSHELRTPITTIQGAVQNLQSEAVLAHADQRGEMLEDLLAASRRLDHLVANLLDMSRLQSGQIALHRDWCDPGDIARAAIGTLRRELQDYPLALSIPDDLPPLQADFGLLEQAIINIIHNAIVHNRPGTAIRIDLSVQDQGLLIRISDTGQGIPEASLAQLFDKFYRAPGARSGGTGLGLSIARGFIEAHSGQISAANGPDGGALFLIKLPLSRMPQLPPDDPLEVSVSTPKEAPSHVPDHSGD